MVTSNLFNKGSVNESRKVRQPYPNARASARTSGENPAPSSRHENGELSSSGSAGSAGDEGGAREAASCPLRAPSRADAPHGGARGWFRPFLFFVAAPV